MEERLLGSLQRLRALHIREGPLQGGQVTLSQMALLDCIAGSPGQGIRDIATGSRLTTPTVSVAIHRLEHLGLVERRGDRTDKRATRISLTEQGQALYERVRGLRGKKARDLLDGLTPKEQQVLLNLLEQALDAADKSEEARQSNVG